MASNDAQPWLSTSNLTHNSSNSTFQPITMPWAGSLSSVLSSNMATLMLSSTTPLWKVTLQCQCPKIAFTCTHKSQMLRDSVALNGFTYPSVIRTCCNDNAIEVRKRVHDHVKFGFKPNQNNLIHSMWIFSLWRKQKGLW